MKTNRTKILSSLALIAILLFQLFWMWNTYHLNAHQMSNDCDEILEEAIKYEAEARANKYFTKHEEVNCGDENPYFALQYALYDKTKKDANLQHLKAITDSLLHKENLPYHYTIYKINTKTGKVLEGRDYRLYAFPLLNDVKTRIFPVRRDGSVGFQIRVLDAYAYITSHNWVLILISILTSLVFVLSIIDQINYIDEQERVRLLREDFSYAMVHDMKSPLTSIIMGTRYLHSGVLDKKPEMKEKYFTIVEDEAQHLLALINRLLTISKLEHGKLSINKKEVALEPMIEDVIDKYEAKSSKPISIQTHIACTTAFADEEYLKEAISNMVDNATKYSKEKIKIKISTSEDDKYIYIKVYDEGIGIAKSELKTIFNRYERAAEHEKNPNKTRGGFGIGLNYVLQVIHAHGGKINVKSEKGKYSEFTISLPKGSEE